MRIAHQTTGEQSMLLAGVQECSEHCRQGMPTGRQGKGSGVPAGPLPDSWKTWRPDNVSSDCKVEPNATPGKRSLRWEASVGWAGAEGSWPQLFLVS